MPTKKRVEENETRASYMFNISFEGESVGSKKQEQLYAL